jgi:CHAT domain-containing protein/tetratricopeptide (TPR) repeat protein
MLGSGHAPSRRHARFEKTFQDLKQIILKGEFQRAMPLYRQAADQAKAQGIISYQIKFLSDLSNCQFAMFHFQDALATMKESRALATDIHDNRDLAKIDSNMSSLLKEVGNLEAAANVAEDGLKYSGALEPEKRSLLFSHLGIIHGEQHRLDQAEPQFAQAIDLAEQAKAYSVEAYAWDARALARWETGKYPEAEQAARQGLELRRRLHGENISNSLLILGMARAGEKDYPSALNFLDQAEEALHRPQSATPPWLVYLRRGQIKAEAADFAAALEDLRKALALAREWRLDIPPNDASRTSSEMRLAEVYQSVVEAGGQLYLSTHNSALVRETFEAAEENRAASLRALLPHENDWRKRLPPHYYELLQKLQYVQAAQMRRGESNPSAELLNLRATLSEIEASVGGSQPDQKNRALDQAHGMLDNQSVLFSFQLGDTRSWVWAVTKDDITLHALPPRAELASKIIAFQRAAGSNGGEQEALGIDLYHCLFGSLNPKVLAKKRWLFTLEGPLFDLPFAALNRVAGKFLIEDHSLQIASGALMLRAGGHQDASDGGFLAVGDPIYNLADPRTRDDRASRWLTVFSRASYEKEPVFARLWGTAREIEVSARSWNAPVTTMLTGSQVSPENFWSKVQTKPDIIHIATHILEENEKPQTGWIAFSLGGNGQLQYVTPQDILAKSISAKLVVLSGCSSGKADIQPATGLMGLTRAWLAAGAGAVIATRWPTVDDDGAFFESFYRSLRQSGQMNPAAALQAASVEMLRSGTWRAKPSFWAGYFLIGNY